MLERIDTECPACHTRGLVMDVAVNDHGDQFFPGGDPQHRITCENCGATSLITLRGRNRDPAATRVPRR